MIRIYRSVSASFLALICFIMVLGQSSSEQPATRMVSIGAHRLNMLIQGQGAPTVVFESGFGGTIKSWNRVLSEVSRLARTVAYDRAGMGESEPGPKPRTATRIAKELHLALKNAGVAPPFALVGHSAGGAYVRVFAHLYPKEVSALLLIEPPQEDLLLWIKTHYPEKDQIPPERLAQMAAGMRDEWSGRDAAIRELKAAWPLPRVPTILLTSRRNDESLAKEVSPEALQILVAARQRWLQHLPHARHLVSEKSGHNVPNEEPKIVIETIKQLLSEVKKN